MLIDAARLQLENTESSADAFNAVAATLLFGK